jgi:Tol biopolymer transport system component
VFSASQDGVLVYQTARGDASTRIRWFGRDGKAGDTVGEPGAYRDVSFSPDEKQAAVSVRDVATGTHDLWTFDLARGLRTRFTFDAANDRNPTWSPDGNTLVFASNRKGHYDLYRKAVGGSSEEEPLLVSENDKFPAVWSKDGKSLLFLEAAKDTGLDIWVLPMEGQRAGKPELFLRTKSSEIPGALSPDGRWLAYLSDESGQWELYATTFPHAGRKWQISPTGGTYGFWSADGKEILFQANDGKLAAVPVAIHQETLDLGQVKPLFSVPGPQAGGPSFAPTADHRRVLTVSGGQEPSALLDLVVNWPAGLRNTR